MRKRYRYIRQSKMSWKDWGMLAVPAVLILWAMLTYGPDGLQATISVFGF